MTDEANPAPAGRAAQGGIPLNLAPLLTPYGQHQRLTIRVVYLPPRAELTRGQRNEDASWSLTPAELEGLELLLPEDCEPPPSVGVRIVGIDRNENASIVGQFEVPLPRSERAKEGSAAAQLAALQRRLDRRAAAAKRLAERKVARALAEAEATWQARDAAGQTETAEKLEQDWQQRITAEQEARRAAEARAEEVSRKVAALTGALEAAQAERTPQISETEIAARIEKAAAEAREQAGKDAAAQLEEAHAAWQAEAARERDAERGALQQQLAEAQSAAEEAASLRAQLAETETLRRDLETTREALTAAQAASAELEAGLAEAQARAESDVEVQLAEREQVLELEWREKLLNERNARQAAEAKAAEAVQQLAPLTAELEAARLRLGTAEAAVAAAADREAELQRRGQASQAQAEARLAQEMESRIAAAKREWQDARQKEDEARRDRDLETRAAASEAGWESNRQRDGEARIAAAVDQAVKKAEIKAQTRLEQARADWEKESRSALAIAEGKWQADAAKRLAAAHAEWNRNSEMELARGRSKLRGAARRQWRAPAWRLVKRTAFAAAGVAAVFVAYAQFKPLVQEYLDFGRWKPKVAAMVDEVKTTALEEYEALTGSAAPHRTVAAELANVRSGPSTDSEVVARLPRDTDVTVLERRGAWIRVPVESARAGEGWLHETLLDGAAR